MDVFNSIIREAVKGVIPDSLIKYIDNNPYLDSRLEKYLSQKRSMILEYQSEFHKNLVELIDMITNDKNLSTRGDMIDGYSYSR